ncbi:patatin-like phospholipase family protein [Sulfurimonas sp. C5]|uniref:patatin-like phospholipase family protein n=1 Tax=Sulfurimonas sp. C5 TaxID=3036947 RepID=UPI002454014F|nr:patatin-like phospholipase family protein [Sulfurimonas sp. C5]MDH4944496.1 patatin-like phospholipase family protein [Sulfurimonas sp. C5]
MAREIKEIVLALSGGGARGAYHLGVLHYLDEHNIKVKAICATSIGSIVATSYAAGISPKQQLEILKSKEVKKLFKFNWFKTSVFNIDTNAAILKKLVPLTDMSQLSIPVYITAVDLDEAQERVFNKGDIYQLCQASSALIPFFQPVKIEEKTYIDGGVFNHIPIAPLINCKVPILGVNLHPFVKNVNPLSLFSYLKRSITSTMQKNTQKAKELCDYFIESPKITDYSIFSLKNFDALFELGYQEAKKTLFSEN